MVEVKLVEQGLQWSDLIVPGATLLASLLGASVAFWFHRRKERNDLNRNKAEEILGEIIQIEDLLIHKGGILYSDMNSTSRDETNNNFFIMEQLFGMITAQTEAYFPKWIWAEEGTTGLLQKVLSKKQQYLEAIKTEKKSSEELNRIGMQSRNSGTDNKGEIQDGEKRNNEAQQILSTVKVDLQKTVQEFHKELVEYIRKKR